MNHLQQAKHAIDTAHTRQAGEQALLSAQIAIAHALVAIAENLDKMAKTQALALEHSEDLYALPGN